ncbi:FAD dependent oxidoreductase [Pyrenophora tritici-repentis]|uniref:FAD dependent oxidoreductase n=1 Tax=Pyrenophora tritici-repentis TaxID=45151 RepID=A0A2W1EWZ5_9PLEO|nr:FAD dependent oxidoreductase [Pyrenophora tritici-repentis]KAF7448626.1 FAD dependent oxidoreductase [Pyrenophora tritici-repentis]KAF7572348.1 FAD dependent oxidoreductase [Pyrenophora tritici-repentis]KAI1516782.1 FAD dependent oxidoreductase [Pyrenophora tritici-repentis]KAI1536779.1 FAD dependent oxidoreductase [Pyrenophora tritici-repentis]
MSTESQKRNIVIIGGGIIGSTTAYFLSHHPAFNKETDTITLLEATKVAGGASGKAGGLLGLWAYPSCIVPLSYKLHQELASKHNGAERWGYRAVHCGQVDMYGVLAKKSSKEGDGDVNGKSNHVSLQKRTQKAMSLLRAAGVPKDLDWVAAEGMQSYEEMGTPLTTAQVHPYLFTTSMAQLAEERGVRILFGSATSINQDGNNTVTSVSYKPKDSDTEQIQTLPATTVILTAGPWTQTIWSPSPISALRAHSITIRPSRPVSAYALFTSITLPTSPTNKRGETVTPEIYARPNNEVYACGSGDHLVPLPTSSDLVACDESRCDEIFEQVASVSEELRDGEVTAKQACYLPEGLLMGAGHTCWGIQNGPATGKLLSEIVWEGEARSAEIGGLDPRKFGV